MSGPDIFISYCRQDRDAARLFAESFEQEGFSVWWDAVMHSGETFDEVIERELRAAKVAVVLWSPRSVSSRWVRAEATQADRANKLVPVRIEPCTLPIIFELTHTAELAEWQGDVTDSNWRSLVKDVHRLIGRANEANSIQAQATAPVAEPNSPPVAARAIEPLADKHGSVLLEPTHAEVAQTKFFKQSDDYRHNESERVHCLRRLHVDDANANHVVGPSGLKIGRTKPADIIVSEPSVSREHCIVEFAADKLRVRDLNSTNGTYIDNKRIGRAEILPVGSVLRVGNVSFEHEVRNRSEVQAERDIIELNLGARSHEPRIARSS